MLSNRKVRFFGLKRLKVASAPADRRFPGRIEHEIGKVGDESIDSLLQQPFHGGQIVHCPDVDAEFSPLRPLELILVEHMSSGMDHVRVHQVDPARLHENKGYIFVTPEVRRRDPAVEHFHAPQDQRIKTGN
jgi:hypothetical protein